MQDLQVSRNTAIRYLDSLIELNLIEKKKIGRDNFYLNKALVDLLITHFRDNSLVLINFVFFVRAGHK